MSGEGVNKIRCGPRFDPILLGKRRSVPFFRNVTIQTSLSQKISCTTRIHVLRHDDLHVHLRLQTKPKLRGGETLTMGKFTYVFTEHFVCFFFGAPLNPLFKSPRN